MNKRRINYEQVRVMFDEKRMTLKSISKELKCSIDGAKNALIVGRRENMEKTKREMGEK